MLESDHLITHSPDKVNCLHCGAGMRIALPIPVADWVKAVKAFAKKHRKCLESKEYKG